MMCKILGCSYLFALEYDNGYFVAAMSRFCNQCCSDSLVTFSLGRATGLLLGDLDADVKLLSSCTSDLKF